MSRRDAAPWVDPWGRVHTDTVEVLAIVDAHRTGETAEHNNGYADLTGDVYVTFDGRRFHQYLTVDYHNNVHYVPLTEGFTPEGARWVQRLDRGTRWVRNGEPYAPWLET